jgi:hypothetical protein
MGPLRVLAIACAVALLLAGCGDDGKSVSPACTQGAAVIETALRGAPDKVALLDRTHLSECISNGTSDADLENVGQVFFTVAEHLGDRALTGDPGAALQLGYLVGATVRGARKTNGVMAELQRRIELVGSRVASRKPAMAGALARGRSAGEARG